jgi:hypothetical protein
MSRRGNDVHDFGHESRVRVQSLRRTFSQPSDVPLLRQSDVSTRSLWRVWKRSAICCDVDRQTHVRHGPPKLSSRMIVSCHHRGMKISIVIGMETYTLENSEHFSTVTRTSTSPEINRSSTAYEDHDEAGEHFGKCLVRAMQRERVRSGSSGCAIEAWPCTRTAFPCRD